MVKCAHLKQTHWQSAIGKPSGKQMETDDAVVLTQRVEAVQGLLEIVETTDGSQNETRLQQLLLELEQDITRFGSQRVLVLDGSQLMDLGVVLYNASRSAFKRMTSGNDACDAAATVVVMRYSRFSVTMARFVAAKLMGLSLTCSRNGSRSDNSAAKKTQFLDECIDVFRSFGRVGGLMLESAKSEADECHKYLALARDAFENCNRIWSQIGLSHLTKIKKNMELEEILEDLWDFGIDRIRVLRLCRRDEVADVRSLVGAVHELHMILPYMTLYTGDLMRLLTEISNDYMHLGLHEDQETFTREILRVCESCEGNDTDKLFSQTKQSLLLNLLESFRSMSAVGKAEDTFDSLPNKNDSVGLLTMSKLYVESKLFDKALHSLRTLFQQNDLNLSIQGARAYAQALLFNDHALRIYQELERNYGDATIEISLDLACNLAVSESETHKKLAISELKRISVHIHEMKRDGNPEVAAVQIEQVHRIIFEAAHSAYIASAHMDCLEWSKLGLTIATVEHEAAFYMRMLSMSSLKIGAQNDAIKWAEDAVVTDLSKKSLFTQFQVFLEIEDTPNENILQSIVELLKERDDFELQDLIAFAKAASTVENKEDVVWNILDDVCSFVAQTSRVDKSFPVGILLQNTAQLAYKCITQMKLGHGTAKDPAEAYSDKFSMYVKILLQSIAKDNHESTKFPQPVFDWFYSMSFNIAKSIDRPEFFLLGADIAKQASVLFGQESGFNQRQNQCLLAAICSEMNRIESLERQKLRDLLDLIDRFEKETFDEDSGEELLEFLTKSVFAIKLRLFDPNTNGLFQMCQARISRSVDSFIDLGELVLFATKFDEATEVRSKYRGLASDLFKYSLQLMLQDDVTSPSKLSYIFRRLISLAESKVNVYEWLEQLVQVTESLDVNLPVTEAEWFVGKSWNIGIMSLRNDDRSEATKFMKISLTVLEKCEQLSIQLGDSLQDQYQHFISS